MTMNNIDKIYARSKGPTAFASDYADYFGGALKTLDFKAIGQVIEVFFHARDNGKRIFFIGNGGSAATASHFANDVAIGTRCSEKPFKAISLTDNNAIITAIANDDGYDQIFVKQLEVLMERGDVVVAISASGNSPNVVKAVELANSIGNVTVGFTGFDGGKLKQLCSHVVHIATDRGEYGPVEAMHVVLVHLMGNYLLKAVEQEKAAAAKTGARAVG
jgi:D-sedoheptulose 7-phosphate isomerase